MQYASKLPWVCRHGHHIAREQQSLLVVPLAVQLELRAIPWREALLEQRASSPAMLCDRLSCMKDGLASRALASRLNLYDVPTGASHTDPLMRPLAMASPWAKWPHSKETYSFPLADDCSRTKPGASGLGTLPLAVSFGWRADESAPTKGH